MKKLLSLALCFAMLLALVPFSAVNVGAETVTDEQGVTYTLSDDGMYYIVSGCDGNATFIEIPETYKGLPVRDVNASFFYCNKLEYNIYDNGKYLGNSNNLYYALIDTVSEDITTCTIHKDTKVIASGAFDFCRALTSIVIPNSVITIGDSAFSSCSALTSVTIPDSVSIIGNRAFSDCNNLEYNTYDNGRYLGNSNNPFCALIEPTSDNITACTIYENTKFILCLAFYRCNYLTSIIIPDSVISIGENAFAQCDSLASIDIPNSVTSIGDWAFSYCKSLTSIVIPNSVTSIGDKTFIGCESLTSIVIPNSVITIGDSAFSSCSTLTSVTIPDSVSIIGNHAFEDCTSLKSIVIPDTVTQIGNQIFSSCTSLTSITIPKSVKSIGINPVSGCTALENIAVEIGNEYYHSEDNCLIETATNTLISGLKNSIVPNYVTSIGSSAFYKCTSLENIEIPNSVTSIGDSAFSYCESLTCVVIPDSVTSIDSSSFDNCENLEYNIYDNAKYLGNGNNPYYVLINTTSDNITGCIIHENTKVIAGWAFAYCDRIRKVVIPNSVTSMGDSVFYMTFSLFAIYCEAESQPEGWDTEWLEMCAATVHWGYKVDDDTSSDNTSSEDTSSDTSDDISSDDTSSGDTSSDISDNTSSGDTSSDETTKPPVEDEPEVQTGDINGNDKVDMTDYILLKRNYFGTYIFTEAQKLIGDINKNNKIDMTDYILLKRVYFGTYTIK